MELPVTVDGASQRKCDTQHRMGETSAQLRVRGNRTAHSPQPGTKPRTRGAGANTTPAGRGCARSGAEGEKRTPGGQPRAVEQAGHRAGNCPLPAVGGRQFPDGRTRGEPPAEDDRHGFGKPMPRNHNPEDHRTGPPGSPLPGTNYPTHRPHRPARLPTSVTRPRDPRLRPRTRDSQPSAPARSPASVTKPGGSQSLQPPRDAHLGHKPARPSHLNTPERARAAVPPRGPPLRRLTSGSPTEPQPGGGDPQDHTPAYCRIHVRYCPTAV